MKDLGKTNLSFLFVTVTGKNKNNKLSYKITKDLIINVLDC